MVFFCNPNNPTGRLVEKAVVLHMAQQHPHIIFVVDEAFIDFVDEPERYSVIGETGTTGNLIVVRSLPKFYGFPGWRQGFNFLPGVTVLPHFDEIPEHIIKPLHLLTGNYLTMLGMDGNTALVLCGEQHEVAGRGGITLWNEIGKTRYTCGPLPVAVAGNCLQDAPICKKNY